MDVSRRGFLASLLALPVVARFAPPSWPSWIGHLAQTPEIVTTGPLYTTTYAMAEALKRVYSDKFFVAFADDSFTRLYLEPPRSPEGVERSNYRGRRSRWNPARHS